MFLTQSITYSLTYLGPVVVGVGIMQVGSKLEMTFDYSGAGFDGKPDEVEGT